jgi:hypothetical protein
MEPHQFADEQPIQHGRIATDMPTRSATAGRWLAGAALLLAIWFTAQVGAALAAGPQTVAESTVAQSLATPTPFRFLTPTPFVPSGATTSTTTGARPPQAGGFPMELAFPILAGGLAAIAGGSLVLRRKTTR